MQTDYQLVTTPDALAAACEKLGAADAVGFDCETTSLDPYAGQLRLMQFTAPGLPTYIVDLRLFAGDGGDAARVESLEPLRRLLAAPRPVKVAHNAKFDAKWVRHKLGVELGGVFDTMLASQMVSAGDSEDRHSLAVVASRYLGQEVDKAEQRSDWGGELSESQLEYAARDAAVMLPLREKLIERLKSDALVKVAQIEFECVLPVAALELAGIYMDAACWREQIEVVKGKRIGLAEDLQAMLSEGSSQGSLFENARTEINLDSHTQLSAALKRMGVPLPDSTRNWKLQPLAADYPVIAKLLEYRTVQKSLTSYGENIIGEINQKTGRIHANFHQIGAPTGRFACTNPNVQQVPHAEEYRRCFRAQGENRKLIIADYCVAKGTRVATARGLMPVESVRAGDNVYLEDGSTAGVSAVIRRGRLPVVRLTLRNGYSLIATSLHRVRVFDDAGEYVWRRIGELRATDCVAVQPGRGLRGRGGDCVALPAALNTHHNNHQTLSTPARADERLAAFLGYVTGDGSLASNALSWVVNQQDADVATWLRESAAEMFGIVVRERGAYRGVIESGIYSTPLAAWCESLGVGKDRVPEFLWASPAPVVAAFLRGLFEADGSVTDSETGKVSFASSRRRLAAEVQQLLLALGVPATLRRQDNTGPGRRFSCWIVSVLATGLGRFAARVGFLSARKRAKLASLSSRWTGKTVAGNMPNLRAKARALGLSGETRRLLNNTLSLGRPVSTSLAARLEQFAPSVAESLGLERLTRYNQLFLPVISVEPAGEEEVFDLSVPGPMTYISDGFVSHNSQIELRILAHVTEDKGFVEAFNSGADLHRVTAAQIFNTTQEGVTREQRDFAKRLNFGVVYGIGAQRFSMMTGLPLSDAEQIMARYFQTYRGLDTWLRDAARRAVRERQARTMSGRLARFNFDSEDRQAASLAQRNGKNMPIQGASADILKRALRLLHDRLKDTSAEIVNIVHDEIVVEADAAQAEEITRAVEDSMCRAGEEFVTLVPVKVETQVSDAWVK